MAKHPYALYAFVLAALCVVGAIVLGAIGRPIPPELWAVAFGAAGAGAGIATPPTP